MNIVFSVFFLIISCVSHASDSEQEKQAWKKLASQVRPDRTNALSVHSYAEDAAPEAFYEYFTSGEDSACGFRIFDLERAEGIELILDNLGDPHIKNFIWSALCASSKELRLSIFGNELNDIRRTDDNLRLYVKYFCTPHVMLEVQENVGAYQDQYPYGLMNALAFLKKKNLFIYKKDGDKLRLAHVFIYDYKSPCIFAQFKNAHFNLLAKADDIEAQKLASEHEDRNISIFFNSNQKRLDEEKVLVPEFSSLESEYAVQSDFEVFQIKELVKNIIDQVEFSTLRACCLVSRAWNKIATDPSSWKNYLTHNSSTCDSIDSDKRNIFHYIGWKKDWTDSIPYLLRKFIVFAKPLTPSITRIISYFPAFLNYDLVALWTEDAPPKNVPRSILYLRLPPCIKAIGHSWQVNPALSTLSLLVLGELKGNLEFTMYYQSRKDATQVVELKALFNPKTAADLCCAARAMPESVSSGCAYDFTSLNQVVGVAAPPIQVFAFPMNMQVFEEFFDGSYFQTAPELGHLSYQRQADNRQIPVYAWPREGPAITHRPFPLEHFPRSVPALLRNAKDAFGKTPLIYAIKHGNKLFSLIAPRLLKEKTNKLRTPLHYAAKYKRSDVMQELLDRGGLSQINEVDNKGNTALFYAIQSDDLEIVKILIQNNADLSIINKEGRNILHYVGLFASPEVYNLLSDALGEKLSIYIEMMDNEGKTPLDYAGKKGAQEEEAGSNHKRKREDGPEDDSNNPKRCRLGE